MTRNPFSINGTDLPAPLLLMARLIVLVLILRNYGFSAMPARKVPFFEFVERIGADNHWRLGLSLVFFLGALLVFFTRHSRLGCALVGSTLIVGTLINAGWFANSRLYPGCILLLCGLWDGSSLASLALRGQVFLLYFGAGINKLFDQDWLNGQYFEFWLREKLQVGWYGKIADSLPPMVLSTGMGLATIAAELFVCLALLRRAWWPIAFVGALLFHITAYLISGLDFGVFLYAVLFSFLVITPQDAFSHLKCGCSHWSRFCHWVAVRPWIWMLLLIAFCLPGDFLLLPKKLLAIVVTAITLQVMREQTHTNSSSSTTNREGCSRREAS